MGKLRHLVTWLMFTVALSGCVFFDDMDRCLDSGGRWNVQTKSCEK